MKNWSIALGFYQGRLTADAVLSSLKKKRISRFATIHRKKDQSVEIKRYFPVALPLFFIAITTVITFAISYYLQGVASLFSLLWPGLIALAMALVICLFTRFFSVIDSQAIKRFKDCVIVDETLVIVQARQSDVREVLSILRQVKSGHPVTFLLRPAMFEEGDVDIPSEPLSMEALAQDATVLAASLKQTGKSKNYSQFLLKRFQKSSKLLQALQQDIADAEYIEQTMPSSAEWLLDNMYVLEGSIEDVKLNLSKKYYKELPKVLTGPLAGFPRIYALAIGLVKSTAGKLTGENITTFLKSAQASYPLTIGEIWAFPLMLRFRLIEWVEFLAIHVDNRMREGELASFWGNRFLCASRHEPNRLTDLLGNLSNSHISLSGHFTEELLDHLFDEESVVPMVRQWLEKQFKEPLADVLRQEHMQETSEQVVFSNSIMSLITLSQLSWPDIFESTCLVDAILTKDLNGIYPNMDFLTRNSYREVIEKMARRLKVEEVEIAKKALSLALQGKEEFERHIGFYLIDSGLEALELEVGYRPTIRQRIHRGMIRHSAGVYIGTIVLATLLIEYFLLMTLGQATSLSQAVLFLTLSLFPASEISMQCVNLLISKILPTPLRPKMFFKEGIREDCKTLVVVPMMLFTQDAIQQEVERLEVRYLANTDPLLRFGLFSDFTDAPKQHLESDAELLSTAIEAIAALNQKYGAGRFFLFHRQRRWSVSENAWIGWERKRGKLEYLNRFLMGETLPEEIVYAGDKDSLKGTRYVITLDADTQLPKDLAKSLVEVLSHPLNRPYLSSNRQGLKRGYTIIQPRVGTDFIHSKASLFCRIFSEPTVVDPYTQAVTNVYQDLAGEGSYHGKGIYDVEAFHTLLSNRFPEEHLLSHDLIEGAFAGVGFASHVCLFDTHPKNYLTWIKRQHRWIRGDFQIIDWIMPKAPNGQKELQPNPLSSINRWKIFDNLRRALLPISLLLLLNTAWLISPTPKRWTELAALVLLLPCISVCISHLFPVSFAAIKRLLPELKILVARLLINTALLPLEAFNSFDAMIRVAFRRRISHRNLLEWTTAEDPFQDQAKTHDKFILSLSSISLFALAVLGAVFFINPSSTPFALPFCFLWLIAPAIIYIIDRPLENRIDEGITENERKILRKIGRQTWRYFDDLVGPQTNWLPPDNYQTALNIEVANRTSPTNIGLWLLSLMSAYNFKYITSDTFVDKALETINKLKILEKHQGHFLNWYNIQTLEPLFPRYVSTVDSGNLLACLWTIRQGMEELIAAEIMPKNALEGIEDTYELLQTTEKRASFENARLQLANAASKDLSSFITAIKSALNLVQEEPIESQNAYWQGQIVKMLQGLDSIISRYFTWVEVLTSLSLGHLQQIDSLALQWKEEILSWRPSLETLADKKNLQAFDKLIAATQKNDLSNEIKAFGKRLQEALSTAQWLAGEKLGLIKQLIEAIDQFSLEMNLKFLYSEDRKLFAIGYNVDDRRLDSSHYDLLASEARIASLVAIAKGEIPLEHWWALGRLYGLVQGRKVLLSWGGTMFEYLMPLIFNKQYSDTLMGEACNTAVSCQIAYGKKRGIPWGISESAYSAIDSHKVYQYKSFGVPGLGLKRGLEEDLVVSPYSTLLALAIDPKACLKNLKEMAEKKHLTGSYGYYDSIDFTRQRSRAGERGVVVYVYMAHHQGMILSSLNNFLNDDPIIKCFHKDPRISGISSLLYERIPFSSPIKYATLRKEPIHRRLEPFSVSPIMGVVETPESVTPKLNILSNGKYSLMITNAGGGYSRLHDIDIYRWRADTTRDCWGSFYYIRDLASGNVWSATHQPTQNSSKEYFVHFKEDKVEFKRKDHKIEALTEIIVSPEDNAEVRQITLINHSTESRHIELTSYLELALAPHLADRAHPCFNKLFIETEALPESSALLARRRLRSPSEPPFFAVHILSTNSTQDSEIQYETDRNKFIGRGRTLKRPSAMDNELSNTTGAVLDPIFSIRKRVHIEPGKRIVLSFITAITDSQSGALALIEKYKDIAASQRAMELAWTYAQLELRHLRIHQEEAQLFQKLASRILYPHAQLRPVKDRLRKNHLGQSGLWSQGISGDLPIVVVSIGDIYDTDLVKQLLIAHTFLALRNLKVDLVILNEEEASYLQPLQENLRSLIQAHSYRTDIDKPGGVFLRNTAQMTEDERHLILFVARAVFIAARGSLRQQLVSPKEKSTYPARFLPAEKVKEEPLSQPLPFLELPYFNGLGGYSPDGCSYVIYLGPGKNTPAPWINVLANPQFGTMVSESGLGCTWYENSQTNRLTPWNNDPLLNPIADVIYIRDEELGAIWTPTPAPIRELDAYRITHSQGYTRFEHNSHGISQELLVFVPVDDQGGLPLRIQHLRLSNHSPLKAKLTVTAYSELVLGANREDTQMHIITEWDSESQALFAYNRYNPNYGSRVAFSFSLMPIHSFSGDRAEFLGRNGSTSSPEALSRKSLSGHTGPALDPCFALQVFSEIEPETQVEIVFILGYAPDAETARKQILQCRNSLKVEQLLFETQSWWNKTLDTVRIETPDMATNFLMNSWLLYQNISCRIWGRSGFYQSSGAYGFRDQLQDVMALMYTAPSIAKEYILKAASRQFIEGDVQHWWHPETGAGVRTRCSDDLLWLPFVTAQYVRVTKDLSILEETAPFLESDNLADGQDELFQVPTRSKEEATLLEHCRRAIKKGITAGPHGLPLIGSGDWNDGMNRVGIQGTGESVWLGWFLIHVMNDFADLLKDSHGSKDSGEGFRFEAQRLAKIIEKTAWDGAWYRRAYFDDGTPIGSKEGSEAIIDSLSQSWAVISGAANPARCAMALKSAKEHLVKDANHLVLLLTPPFDKISLDPGYIKGYPPGVRENGGQYTHGSSWLAMAFARIGEGDVAADILRKLSPTSHTQTPEANELYKIEPYVIAADIYDLKNQVGRGGWSWYTGSAGWIYRIWLEEVLGFTLRGETLSFNCSLPKEWDGFKMSYQYKSSRYNIAVSNPHHICRGDSSITLDGILLPSAEITLIDDGKPHTIDVLIRPKTTPENPPPSEKE